MSVIYSIRSIVDKFIAGDLTVNLCTIDLSKAFDKMNHHALLIKLMNRQLPVNILQILERWFDISITRVKLGNQVSNFIALQASVRQGGALSPCLFAIFIDDTVINFKTLGRFCNSEYVCTNIFVYADDIVFLSPSFSILQDMLYL